MLRKFLRFIANAAIVCGFFLLVRVIYGASEGTLAAQFFPDSATTSFKTLLTLCLGLPVPLHIISVGMILQRRWLSPAWSRIAMPAVVISGCWLGAAIALKWFLIS
jgi:hypothetical protein